MTFHFFQDQSSSNDKADKFGDDDVDYEYTNDSGTSTSSDTSRFNPAAATMAASSFTFIFISFCLLGRVNLADLE